MVELFGLEIIDPNETKFEDYKNAQHIVTMNMEQFILAQENLEYQEIIKEASMIVPDGESLVLLAKFQGKPLHKLAGIDLARRLIDESENVVFWGADLKVSEKLKEKFPNGIFFQHGFYDLNEEINLIKRIPKEKVDLFLVALGSPCQELFINKYKKNFPKATFIGVGGSFDIWAEKLSRAPKLIIDLRLEWLYRIYQEPSRIKKFSKNLFALLKYLFGNF